MSNTLSQASQDYLKAIYKLTAQHGRATTSQIAKALDVRPASVTGMLKKMAQAEPPLLEYEKHRGVTLTPQGEKEALKVVRHHRLLESYLHDKLGYSWDEVHEEADRLEHVISDEMEMRMDEALGYPRRDPHGQQIPTPALDLSPSTTTSLSELRPGQQATVQRVGDENARLLRHLDRLGLRPKTRIAVLEYEPLDQLFQLQVSGQNEPVVIGPQIATQVFVKPDSIKAD